MNHQTDAETFRTPQIELKLRIEEENVQNVRHPDGTVS
jgi:hypothetical protein